MKGQPWSTTTYVVIKLLHLHLYFRTFWLCLLHRRWQNSSPYPPHIFLPCKTFGQPLLISTQKKAWPWGYEGAVIQPDRFSSMAVPLQALTQCSTPPLDVDLTTWMRQVQQVLVLIAFCQAIPFALPATVTYQGGCYTEILLNTTSNACIHTQVPEKEKDLEWNLWVPSTDNYAISQCTLASNWWLWGPFTELRKFA